MLLMWTFLFKKKKKNHQNIKLWIKSLTDENCALVLYGVLISNPEAAAQCVQWAFNLTWTILSDCGFKMQ